MRPLNLFFIFLLVFVLFFLGQYLYFYPGRYQPPPEQKPSLEHITLPITEIKTFTDVFEKQKGLVLIDFAHNNNFRSEEISLLIHRITSRGFDIEYLKENQDLEIKLRYADAFLVILPQEEFTKEETDLIKEFREKGGKVLLIADPTRFNQINSLATDFGIIFESDYLYNQKENDGNFRHIFISDFKSDSDLTKNLERIVLYSASSISSLDLGIAFTDENTFSSVSQIKTNFSPIVLSPDSRVLAISDLTFLVEPYNTNYDNNQFIANLTDWLTKSERIFSLSDFPYFFEDEIQLTYVTTTNLDSSLKLKNFLQDLGKSSKISQYQRTMTQDLVFLGLFDEAEKVRDFLKKGEITINEDKVKIEGIGEINRKGTSILYFDKPGNVLIALSDTKERLGESIDRLVSGQFRDWLVSDTLSLHHIEVEEPEEEEI